MVCVDARTYGRVCFVSDDLGSFGYELFNPQYDRAARVAALTRLILAYNLRNVE